MQPGDKVRLTAPWNERWPEVYVIAFVEAGLVYLEGIEGAFDPRFVEAADGP